MTNTIISLLFCIKDIAAVISLMLVFQVFFAAEKRKGKIRLISVLIAPVIYNPAVIFALTGRCSDLYELIDGISMFYCLIATAVLLKTKHHKGYYAFVFFYLFTADILWSLLFTFINLSICYELIFYIIIFSVIAAAAFLVRRNYPDGIFSGLLKAMPKWMIAVLLFFELTCYYKEFGISTDWYNVLYTISVIAILVSIIFLIIRIIGLLNTQNSITQKLNEQLLSNEISAKSDEELRKFRHDFKNHLIAINSMFSRGDYKGAENYFAEISGTVASSTSHISTGNQVVNSILSVKQSVAEKHNAKIEFHGMIPDDGIKYSDMCICIGNLIDNAIEACAKLPQEDCKIINIDSSVRNGGLFVKISNPADNTTGLKAKRVGDLPTTSKKDKRAHGYGLKNVRRIADEYNGSLKLSESDGIFTAELLLFLALNSADKLDKHIY